MKKVTYEVTQNDLDIVESKVTRHLSDLSAGYKKNPENFHGTKESLIARWKSDAVATAVFWVIENDQLAHITCEDDDFASMDQLKGDCFNPDVNPDVDKKAMKREERAFERMVRKEGVHYHEMIVLGESVAQIAGCVGQSFYGSGYDTDFYRAAIEALQETHSNYCKMLLVHANQAADGFRGL